METLYSTRFASKILKRNHELWSERVLQSWCDNSYSWYKTSPSQTGLGGTRRRAHWFLKWKLLTLFIFLICLKFQDVYFLVPLSIVRNWNYRYSAFWGMEWRCAVAMCSSREGHLSQKGSSKLVSAWKEDARISSTTQSSNFSCWRRTQYCYQSWHLEILYEFPARPIRWPIWPFLVNTDILGLWK